MGMIFLMYFFKGLEEAKVDFHLDRVSEVYVVGNGAVIYQQPPQKN